MTAAVQIMARPEFAPQLHDAIWNHDCCLQSTERMVTISDREIDDGSRSFISIEPVSGGSLLIAEVTALTTAGVKRSSSVIVPLST